MYSPDYVTNTFAKKESRVFNQVKRKTDGAGDSFNFMQEYSENPSGSADFTKAQAMGQAAMTAAKQFSVPYYDEFSLFSVSGGFIARTKRKEGGWLPALKDQTDSSFRLAHHRKSVGFYTSGWGELGQVSSPGASTTLTLTKKSHIYRFYQGQKLVLAEELNTTVLRNSGAVGTVSGVNYDAGTLTMAANVTTTWAAAATGDWIFTDGDRQDSATPAKLRMTGLGCAPISDYGTAPTTIGSGFGWVPAAAPAASESFFGVDRSTNSYLYGRIINLVSTPMSLIAALTTGAQTASSIGNAETLLGVMSPTNFTALSNSMQGQARYTEMKGRGGVSFKTIVVYADGIEMPIISDKYCPDEVIYGLDPSTIQYISCGEAPALDDSDGNTILRQASDNGVEGRIVSYETLVHRNPASSFVILTGSTT